MQNNYKPGGGNKPQPYIPAGNGAKSGEYTNKSNVIKPVKVVNCSIRNIRNKCNFLNSSLVKQVNLYIANRSHDSAPAIGKPNSVVKKIINGYVVSERYYNNKGEAYLDIDYTCHGNPKTHPEVPHVHRWYKDEKGHLRRCEKRESFK